MSWQEPPAGLEAAVVAARTEAGSLLAAFRQTAGLSPAELAARIGYNPTAVAHAGLARRPASAQFRELSDDALEAEPAAHNQNPPDTRPGRPASSEKGSKMTSDRAAAPARGGSARGLGPLPFDTSKAHQARMYDHLLGGKDNYAADRAATEAALKIWPDMAFAARANRAFLGRAVRYLTAEAGIRQFLDIGSGMPAAGNLHQVAQAIAPETRVAYADYDPVVLAHARALLNSTAAGATGYIDADLRDTGTILGQAGKLLDFTRPTAIMLVAILHVIPEADDPYAIVARLLDAVPPGSYLVVSHLGADLLGQDKQDGLTDLADRMIQQAPVARTREQVACFFEGTELAEPGLVPAEQWRPEPGTGDTGNSSLWAAVARKH